MIENPDSEFKITPEIVEEATSGLEKMAQRWSELMEKRESGITDQEEKELQLIENNARPLAEIIKGIVPWEFKQKEPD